MQFIYSAGAMGLGNGYLWHKIMGFKFPAFPVITKTITLNKKIGFPFAVMRIGNSVFNHISHSNPGIIKFLLDYYNPGLIVSIAGTDDEIELMVNMLNQYDLSGIQLSFSCPNVKDEKNKRIPDSKHPLYLKLNYKQDPYSYDLSKVHAITVNTVPCIFGGASGYIAQKYNFPFIKKFNNEGLNVIGSSFISTEDMKYLYEYCGCKTLAIGSIMLINPRLVQTLK